MAFLFLASSGYEETLCKLILSSCLNTRTVMEFYIYHAIASGFPSQIH